MQHVEPDAVLFLEIEQPGSPEESLVGRAGDLQLVLRPLVGRIDGVARVALYAVAVELALVELRVAADVAGCVAVPEADVEPRADAVGVEVQVAGGRRVVHAVVEIHAADVAGALVEELLVGEEPVDVVGQLQHRADAERAEVHRAVLAVGLELIAFGELRTSVLLFGRPGNAQRPSVGQRHVDHAAEAEQRVAARDEFRRRVESARIGLCGVQRDRAAGRVAAEQRALRTAQDFDAIEVVEHHGRALRARREHAVRIERDALVSRLGLVTRAEAANEDQRDRVVAVFEELQVRHQAAHVQQRYDAIVVQRLLVECRDGEWRLLQGRLAPRGGDDDRVERRLVACLRLRV